MSLFLAPTKANPYRKLCENSSVSFREFLPTDKPTIQGKNITAMANGAQGVDKIMQSLKRANRFYRSTAMIK